jgi:hypothetical protein
MFPPAPELVWTLPREVLADHRCYECLRQPAKLLWPDGRRMCGVCWHQLLLLRAALERDR